MGDVTQGGFVEISRNTVNIMSDSCEEAGEIDGDRAKKALERAEARLRVLELMEK